MSVSLDFAYDENKSMVYVDDVANGVACNCVCPICGNKLVAFNGGKKQAHHFTHYDSPEHAVNSMTRLHFLAELILAKRCSLRFVANAAMYIQKKHVRCIDWIDCPVDNKVLWSCDIHDGRLEYTKGDGNSRVRYDVFYPESRLAIEVRVTHAVDDEKRAKIVKNNDMCVEIDLSQVSRTISYSDLEAILSDIVVVDGIYDRSRFGDSDVLMKASESVSVFCFGSTPIVSRMRSDYKQYASDVEHLSRYKVPAIGSKMFWLFFHQLADEMNINRNNAFSSLCDERPIGLSAWLWHAYSLLLYTFHVDRDLSNPFVALHFDVCGSSTFFDNVGDYKNVTLTLMDDRTPIWDLGVTRSLADIDLEIEEPPKNADRRRERYSSFKYLHGNDW